MRGKVFAAIDIGTTTISLVAAEVTEKGARVLGSCTKPSRGLRKGVVINIEEAAASIRTAVIEAESATDRRISSAVIGISGPHIERFLSAGLIGLYGRQATVSDRTLAIESAKTVYIPLDREVLHVIPTEFRLDGQKGITDPVGMSGVRLESTVHIITAHSLSMQNLSIACRDAGLEVLDMVFGPVATAEAVLTRDELDRGALLVDIGGGTTDVAFFKDGVMQHASILGIGGLHITSDLAFGLKVSPAEAERVKNTAGLATIRVLAGQELIDLTQQDGQQQKVSRQLIAAIIQPRCEELFEKVREELKKISAVNELPCSVILTGGTALLSGISGLAASVLGMPARVGLPQAMPGMKNDIRVPTYAVAVGLVAYATMRAQETFADYGRAAGVLNRAAEKIRNAFGYKDFLEIIQKKKKGVSYV